ncbi:MAG: cytochrome c peroxidase [Bacteriovoracaceae bacterium]|jgi:cytochrome c peroxidase
MHLSFILPLLLTLVISCSDLPTSKKAKSIEINLSSRGNDVAFEQENLQIPFGQTVKLVFQNQADLDSEISHNVAIVRRGHEKAVMDILNKEEYDFSQTIDFFKTTNHLLASSKILNPGENGEIIFEPETPGYYTYICLMPGHGNILHMKGKILVKDFSSNLLSSKQINEMKAEYIRETVIPFPEDNPYSKAKYDLGKKLFFDVNLSKSKSISCATCHAPQKGFEDGVRFSEGVKGTKLARHSQTATNLAWGELFFWDGRASSLEAQAVVPILSKEEMGLTKKEVIKVLSKDKDYLEMFKSAFPGKKVDLDTAAMAIATFERKLVTKPSDFDRWVAGDANAISESARRGFVVFNEKANCAACHSGWRFTDDSFHDIGVDSDDLGRGRVHRGVPILQHAFKVPSLRNIVERAPYMHNGSKKTLMDVIEFYNKGGEVKRESLSEEIFPLNLSDQEKLDLLSLMKTLSSEVEIE